VMEKCFMFAVALRSSQESTFFEVEYAKRLPRRQSKHSGSYFPLGHGPLCSEVQHLALDALHSILQRMCWCESYAMAVAMPSSLRAL
jgi:hypothetical protein